MINFKCTKCGHDYKVPDNYAGKKVRCTQCQTVNSIPSAESCGDTIAAYNNLFDELLRYEKQAPSL